MHIQYNSDMEPSKITQIVNLKKMDQRSKRNLRSSCKHREFTKKLKSFNEFFESKMWKSIHDLPFGHDFAFDFTEQTFGNGNSFIYDKCEVTHGKELWDKFSPDCKEFIIDIDTNKKEGIYRYKNLYIKYIGSVTGVSAPISGGPYKAYNQEEVEEYDEEVEEEADIEL